MNEEQPTNPDSDTVEEDANIQIKDLVEAFTPLADRLLPQVLEHYQAKAPETKRRQNNSFCVVISIVVATFVLALWGNIDGSAAMVIFGAVLYYIFRTQSDTLLDQMLRPKR